MAEIEFKRSSVGSQTREDSAGSRESNVMICAFAVLLSTLVMGLPRCPGGTALVRQILPGTMILVVIGPCPTPMVALCHTRPSLVDRRRRSHVGYHPYHRRMTTEAHAAPTLTKAYHRALGSRRTPATAISSRRHAPRISRTAAAIDQDPPLAVSKSPLQSALSLLSEKAGQAVGGRW
jgi:hypothetical protein